MFRCDWFDVGDTRRGINVCDHTTSVNMSRTWYADEPFALATKASQVFYLKDTNLGYVVQKITYRNVYDIPQLPIVDDVDDFDRMVGMRWIQHIRRLNLLMYIDFSTRTTMALNLHNKGHMSKDLRFPLLHYLLDLVTFLTTERFSMIVVRMKVCMSAMMRVLMPVTWMTPLSKASMKTPMKTSRMMVMMIAGQIREVWLHFVDVYFY